MYGKRVTEIIKPNAEDELGDYWDPWEALGLDCCSYNSELDQAAIDVARCIASDEFMYCTDIAERTGLTPLMVEMFQGVFSSANWCEYGTSPRGCWFIDREGAPALVAAWEAYYQRHWGEPAQGIETRSAGTEGSSPKGESPVPR